MKILFLIGCLFLMAACGQTTFADPGNKCIKKHVTYFEYLTMKDEWILRKNKTICVFKETLISKNKQLGAQKQIAGGNKSQLIR